MGLCRYDPSRKSWLKPVLPNYNPGIYILWVLPILPGNKILWGRLFFHLCQGSNIRQGISVVCTSLRMGSKNLDRKLFTPYFCPRNNDPLCKLSRSLYYLLGRSDPSCSLPDPFRSCLYRKYQLCKQIAILFGNSFQQYCLYCILRNQACPLYRSTRLPSSHQPTCLNHHNKSDLLGIKFVKLPFLQGSSILGHTLWVATLHCRGNRILMGSRHTHPFL